MRRIRIGDRKRFRRLLILLAVIVLAIAIEAGYFIMEARVSELPEKIKAVNKQTEDIKADNVKLHKENEKLGDGESKKELKESWERLRDKVKEAVGETSS
jgi:cell division protein FtsB